MTADTEALARRAVACKGWRWVPGMLGAGTGLRLDELTQHWEAEIPDLSDPCTLGGLTALLAEAYGVTLDDVHVVRTTGMVWSVWIFRADDSSYRVATHEPSRAEALVAALEAAP